MTAAPSQLQTSASGHLVKERFLLLPHDEILAQCRRVNATTQQRMDYRLPINLDVQSDLVKNYPAFFAFFAEKRFLEKSSSQNQNGGDDRWIINSKLDDEWAVNIFSQDVDLLATGIYKLDDVLKGGFRLYRDKLLEDKYDKKCAEPCLVTLQGRPGTGKTTIGLQILSNFAAQGYSSVYASAEQSIESLKRTIRRFCRTTEWSSSASEKVVRCRLLNFPENDRSRFAAELSRYAKDHIPPPADNWLDMMPPDWQASFCDWLVAKNNKLVATNYCCERERQRQQRKQHGDTEPPFAPTPERGEFLVVVYDNLTDTDISHVNEFVAAGWHAIVLAPIEDRPGGNQIAVKDDKVNPRGGGFLHIGPVDLASDLLDIYKGLGVLPTWLALDSITAFRNLGGRKSVNELRKSLVSSGLPTSLLFLTEFVSDDANKSPTEHEILSDTIIQLGERPLQIAEVEESASNYMQRYLEVRKCRLAPFHRGKHPIAIKSYSVKVYRSIAILLKATGKRRRSTEFLNDSGNQDGVSGSQNGSLNFGVLGLDGAVGLNGSLRKGSVTVLAGPPGSHRTGISTYFLTEPIRAYLKVNGGISDNDEKANHVRGCPRSIIYSFGGDRRGVENGMEPYINSSGERIYSEDVRQHVMVRDISPGYLFPEAFIEDLIDLLRDANEPQGQSSEGLPRLGKIERVVFDSFDSVHAAFPIMRMDQFLWKLIYQVCCDYKVSAIVKITSLEHASEYYRNMAALVTSMADNIIRVSHDDQLQVVESETGAHPRGSFRLETEYWDDKFASYGIEDPGPGTFPRPGDFKRYGVGLLLKVRRMCSANSCFTNSTKP